MAAILLANSQPKKGLKIDQGFKIAGNLCGALLSPCGRSFSTRCDRDGLAAKNIV